MLPAVSEDFLTSLLPFLLEGLGRGAGQDYRAATLMVVAELCSKATLGRDCIKGGCHGRVRMLLHVGSSSLDGRFWIGCPCYSVT